MDNEKERVIAKLFEIGRFDVSIKFNGDQNDGIFYEITDFKGSVLYRGDERYFNYYPTYPMEALEEYRKIMHTIELARYNKLKEKENS